VQKPLRLRRAGRVIVLDPQGKVLLFRYDDPPPNGRHWSTPGGGLDGEETFHDGAVRELAEETGWTDVPVGTEVLTDRTFTMEYMGELVRQREQLFPARVDVPERELGQVAAMHEDDGIAGWHWWGLDELDATSDDIWPNDLPDIIRRIYIVLRYSP
jgi:8-oxo-dGTP pyrophosphatase MutT (NUDIX family)